MVTLRLSPTRGVSLNAPWVMVAAVFWSRKATLPTPPLQKTPISAAHFWFGLPTSSTSASGFLLGATWQRAIGTVVDTDRNFQCSRTAVAYPARAFVTATGIRPTAAPAAA